MEGDVQNVDQHVHGFHNQSSFEAYDPESDSWTLEGNLQIARHSACAVVAQDKIDILGGFDGVERLASVECITPGLVNTVRHEVPPMLHRRNSFSALLLDPNTIMVVGGFREDPEDVDGEWTESGDVELLDLVRNVWTVAPSLTVPRFALQAIKVENMYRRFVLESVDVEAAGGTDEVLQNILLAHVKLDLLGPLEGGLDEGLYGVL